MALNFPGSPVNGQTYQGYVYSSAVGAWQAKPAAQSPFYTSDTPPANPVAGDSWFNTNDGTMYIYVYDGNTYQWVEHRSQIAKSQVGLVPVVPSSVAVGSGTASVDVAGMVTFTGVNSLLVNGAFSSAYRNYHIVLNVNSSTADYDLAAKFSTSGTVSTSGYYVAGERRTQGGVSYNYASGANAGQFYIAAGQVAYNVGKMTASIDVYNPFIIMDTFARINSYGTNPDGSGFNAYDIGTTHDSPSRDGIYFVPSSGNMTGVLKVYGYN